MLLPSYKRESPFYSHVENRIGGVMVNVFVASVMNRGFEPRSGQTKDYKIDICCFSTKHIYPRTVVSVRYHYKNPTKHVSLV